MKEPTTYADLKRALDALTPEQLAMPTRWTGEEIGGDRVLLDILTEPHVMTDDGYMAISAAAGNDATALASIRAEYPNDPEWPAGTPIINVDLD